MSTYGVNSVGRRVVHDPAFRELLRADPEAALDELELTDEERAALMAGDVTTLYRLGAHEYLLVSIALHGALGLDPKLFSERIRAAGPRRARPA